MEGENEEDEKFEIHPNKDVIKPVSFTIFIVSINISSDLLYYDVINQVPIYHQVDGGSLMEMDKTFQQLKIHVIDLCHVASNSSCENFFTEFEEKYATLKEFFLGLREKPLRKHEEGTKSDILSCEKSLDQKDNKKGNEHYVHTLSIDKLCTEDLNGKNEDAYATSIEVHIIPNENVDILPLPIKRTRKDYGKVYII